MDKIKNILNPGSKKDDEVMYGSGQSGDPVHSGGQSNPVGSSNTTENTHDALNPTSSTRGHADSSNRPSKAEKVLGSQDPMGGSSTTRDIYPTDDTATTASVKSGVPGEGQTGKTIGSGTHGTATNTTGPHSSSLGNKIDPRIDSDGDGRGGLGAASSTPGARDYGAGQGSTALPDRSVGSAGYDNTTGQSGASDLGRDAALGAGALGVGGAAAHHRHHHHHHDDEGRDVAGSDTGRSFPLMGGTGNPASSTAAGPHSSNLANKADPRVDSDLDGSRGIPGASGINSGTTGMGNNPASGGYGPEFWEKEDGHAHDFRGDPCHGQEKPVEGVVHHTHGPHSLDIANALDPHVGGTTTSKSALETTTAGDGIGSGPTTTGLGPSTTGSAIDSSTTSRKSGPRDDIQHGSATHQGPTQHDPALSAATATTGVRAGTSTASSQHEQPTTGGETLTGPVHNSGLLNKMDPRVKSVSEATPTSGINEPSTSSTSHSDHHHGRDAGLTGGTAAGAAAYEVGKDHEGYSSGQYSSDTSRGLHSGVSAPSSSAPSSGAPVSHTPGMTGPTGTSGDIPKRDAGVVGGGGAAAYEAEKRLGHHDQSTLGSDPSRTTGGTSGLTSTVPTSSTNASTKDHQGGGLAAAGAGVGVGGVAAYEAEKLRQPHQTNPSHPSALSASQKPYSYEGGRGTAQHELGASRKPYNQYDDTVPQSTGEHTGLGTVGAGVGAATAAGMSEKEIKKLEKEHAKEEKTHGKELEKEQKAIAKEEKKHHDHDTKVIEKKHEKDEKKHAHDDGKSEKKHHGGILGLFKRDKPDDELKQEELGRKYTEDDHTNIPSMAEVGMSEKEKHALAKDHDRNRLHKDPPAGYYEKVAQNDPSYAQAPQSDASYTEAPQKGYASQVTGGTGTTALAQGKEMPTGSHLTETGNKMDPSVAPRGASVDQSALGGPGYGEGLGDTSTTGTTQIPTRKYDVRDPTTDPSPHGL